MKIKIARDELLTGLQRVQGIVEKRNTMPVLSNILLETKQDGVELVATDLEIGIRGHYKAEVCQAGSVTLSARKLYEILKEVADGEVTFTTQENNWVQLQAGRSQFKIVGMAASEFPALPTIEREGRVAIPGSGLSSLLRKTLFAVGDNDARYILNGLLITLLSSEKKVTMKLVGTDGHRLAIAESELANAGTDLPKEVKAIIPRKAAQEMRRLLEEEELSQLPAGHSEGERQEGGDRAGSDGGRTPAGRRALQRQDERSQADAAGGHAHPAHEQPRPWRGHRRGAGAVPRGKPDHRLQRPLRPRCAGRDGRRVSHPGDQQPLESLPDEIGRRPRLPVCRHADEDLGRA